MICLTSGRGGLIPHQPFCHLFTSLTYTTENKAPTMDEDDPYTRGSWSVFPLVQTAWHPINICVISSLTYTTVHKAATMDEDNSYTRGSWSVFPLVQTA